jgi:hypothetical protein
VANGARQVGPGRRAHRALRRGRLRHLHAGQQRRAALSVLKSFAAPPPVIVDDPSCSPSASAPRRRACSAWSAFTADPVQSREHILLSTSSRAWRGGEPLDLPALIGRVQSPPVQKVGVLDLEAFFPPKDRFALAMRLNNLLASPAFAAWLRATRWTSAAAVHAGRHAALSPSSPSRTSATRAHVLRLAAARAGARLDAPQSGTTSLRAILYMDEVAGYLPPSANPPSKAPLLTLLKQARAFGLGVVLATQNPVDLDYKALSNIGTWFLGRLQTERDKLRVLDGLEGALSGTGRFERADVDAMLSALGKRVFLMHNVHDEAPTVFETRWAMSYLAGPLTREQIRTLMAPRKVCVKADRMWAGMSSGPSTVWRYHFAPSGARRLKNSLRSRTTSGSAFSWMVREAEVCCTKAVSRPVRNCCSRTHPATWPVIS